MTQDFLLSFFERFPLQESAVQKEAQERLLSYNEPFSPLFTEVCAALSQHSCMPNAQELPYQIHFPKTVFEEDLKKLSLIKSSSQLLCYALPFPYVAVSIPPGVRMTLSFPSGSMGRIHCIIGEDAYVECIFPDETVAMAVSFDIHAGGTVVYKSVYSKNRRLVLHCDVHVGENSSFQYIGCTLAKRLSQTCTVYLEGKNGNTSIHGLSIAYPQAVQEKSFTTHHLHEASKAIFSHKAILAEKSSVTCMAKHVLRSQKSVCHSYMHTLTCGEKVHSRGRPSFEIFHDDVEARHGCTCMAIDADFLAYAHLRGLPTLEAKRIFIQGFCSDMTSHFPIVEEGIEEIV